MVIPINISLPNWAASLQIDLNYSNVPILQNELEWKEWAKNLLALNNFSDCPDPMSYKNWQDWAIDFFRMLN